ncbi:heavy-metal-associated domain-containing protein [Microbacterium sp. NPDC008134]|uniref:heavy-metal-associated domain-containing protein n=1 Tax=Microbacterium sp. NPDC008134 TaxID=3364183 RepID=UPI0036E6B5E0
MGDTTTEFRVTGMTCGHCEMSVREEVEQIDGVEVVDVSAQSGMLRITAPDVDDAQIFAAVSEAGYSAVRV